MKTSWCVLPAGCQSPSQRGTVASVCFVPPFACASKYAYCSSELANSRGGLTTCSGGPKPPPKEPAWAKTAGEKPSANAPIPAHLNRLVVILMVPPALGYSCAL